MIRKLVFVAAVVGVGLLVTSEKARSKARDIGDKVVAWVDKKMEPRKPEPPKPGAPGEPEKKLSALRTRLKDLDAEVSSVKDRLAQQMHEHQKGAEALAKLRAEVDATTKELTARAKAIDEGRVEPVSVGGPAVAASAARRQLEREADLLALKKALLAQTEEAVQQSEQAVAVLKQHQTELETLALEATTRLAKLDLELKALRMSEVRDRFEAKDTNVGQFLDGLKEVEDMVEVKKIRRSLDPVKATPVSVPAPAKQPTESASDSVARKLGLPTGKKIEKAGD